MLTLLSTSVVFSQAERYRTYTTQKVNERLKRTNVALANQQSQVERFIAEQSKKIQFKKLTIPVVFHIVYAAGQEYPSEAQVYSQIEALNRDFSKRDNKIKHPADTLEGFAKRAEDMEIEFCLAKEGPTGVKEPSIRFLASAASKFTDDDLVKTQRFGSLAWDTKRYLNIWVANLADTVSGYAQMPSGPDETDGIVIDYRYFGSERTALAPYNEGKTLTHLIGNYLGLHDLWGEYTCSDDYVDDTPLHNAPNYGCPTYKHVSTCGDNPVEMTMNFMDNTNDACQYMFTMGQKIRMHAILSKGGPREGLVATATKCDNNDTKNVAARTSPDNPASSNLNLPVLARFYPNPAYDQISIYLDASQEELVNITAFDYTGKAAWKQSYPLGKGAQTFTIDCHNWSSGLYFFKVESSNGISTHNIVIVHN